MRRHGLLVASLVLTAGARPAFAHDMAMSSFDARAAVSPAGPGLQIVFRLNATSVVDLLDRARPAYPTPATRATIAARADGVLRYLDERFTVAAGDRPCGREPPRSLAHDATADVVVVDVVYRCPGAADPLKVRLESTLFHDETIPHELIGTIRDGNDAKRYFFTRPQRVKTVTLQVPRLGGPGGARIAEPPPGAFSGPPRPSVMPPEPTPAAPAPARAAEAEAIGNGFGHFYGQGIVHILGGFDHLLFVLSLLLAVDGWRRLAGVITAFTIAHSLTLVLGSLGLIVVSPRLVEPAIAVTIAVVAIEAIVRRGVQARPGLTFAFGLVHGFGFSGLLRGHGYAASELAVPLLGFNLGVETGQLLVVAPLFPALLWLRTRPALYRRTHVALSVAIALCAAAWFVERVTTT